AALHRAKSRYMQRRAGKLADEAATLEPFDRSVAPDGINMIGPICERSGLGQSMRLVAEEIDSCGDIPLSIREYHLPGDSSQSETTWANRITENLPYNINIIKRTPLEFPVGYFTLGREVFNKHYNIAHWVWELEEFPAEWAVCASVVDEIWTPSDFSRDAIARVVDKPVYTIPDYVSAPVDLEQYDRAHFGLSEDEFVCLVMYDSGSVMDRKNPMGAIEAYRKAFSDLEIAAGGRTPALMVKMNGRNDAEEQRLREYLSGCGNVHFITKSLSKVEVNSLIANADVFISLHRAEGFGLVMAEAMLVGTPCVATNYSGNTEFMNGDVACMVDYELVPLTRDIGPYQKGMHWAEPDVDQAAEYLRKLYQDEAFYGKLQQAARSFVQERLGLSAIQQRIRARYSEILNR
ncbi:MAG: glycosyltransferase, partial [Lachnospiraceae bacterium]|nr:glycosyltransferase [Lachnospiraceae bacterium]